MYSNDKSVNCSMAEWRIETPQFQGYIFSIFLVIFWFRSIGKRERNICSLLRNVEISQQNSSASFAKKMKKVKKSIVVKILPGKEKHVQNFQIVIQTIFEQNSLSRLWKLEIKLFNTTTNWSQSLFSLLFFSNFSLFIRLKNVGMESKSIEH